MQERIITNEEWNELHYKDFDKYTSKYLLDIDGQDRWCDVWNCNENGEIKGTPEQYTLLQWR